MHLEHVTDMRVTIDRQLMVPKVFSTTGVVIKTYKALKGLETKHANTYATAIGFSKSPASEFPLNDVNAKEPTFAPFTHFFKLTVKDGKEKVDANSVQNATVDDVVCKLSKPQLAGDSSEANSAFLPFWCVAIVREQTEAHMKVAHVVNDGVAFWQLTNAAAVKAFTRLKVWTPPPPPRPINEYTQVPDFQREEQGQEGRQGPEGRRGHRRGQSQAQSRGQARGRRANEKAGQDTMKRARARTNHTIFQGPR